ncbi:hypothetical protein EV363DRAFT_1157218, partial [Boletus edulis]
TSTNLVGLLHLLHQRVANLEGLCRLHYLKRVHGGCEVGLLVLNMGTTVSTRPIKLSTRVPSLGPLKRLTGISYRGW